MTDRTRHPRASKRELRAWSWVAGGLAFVTPWVALEAAPKPMIDAPQGRPERPVMKVRRITRLVIIREQPPPVVVRYVYTGSAAASSSSYSSSVSSDSSSASNTGSTSNGPPPANDPPPANEPPPTTNTGGS